MGRAKQALGVFVLLAVGSASAFGGFTAYKNFAAAPPQAAAPKQTVPASRGTISATVSAVGSVVSDNKARVGFKSGGRLKEVRVSPGDKVKAGDVLARLDTAELELQLTQSEASLKIAKLRLDQLKAGSRPEELTVVRASYDNALANLRKVEAGATAADLAAAESSVQSARLSYENAQANLRKTEAGATASDTAAAESSVISARGQLSAAEQRLAELLAQPKAEDIRAAEISLSQARNSLWSQQLSRDGTCGDERTKRYQCDAANAQVGNAEESVNQAMIRLETARKTATPEAIQAAKDSMSSAKASLESAKVRLEQVKSGPVDDDLTIARNNVASAKANLDSATVKLSQLRAGPTPEDLTIAKNNVASAKANLDLKLAGATDTDIQIQQETVRQQEAALSLAQANLANATLVAPMDATIGAITAFPGEMASGPFITLVSDQKLRIDSPVDESEVAQIRVGQPVQITFDSLSGTRITGKVAAIAPEATVQQGVVTYVVTTYPDSTTAPLRAGMSASVSITVAQRDNVVLVPNRAARTEGRNRIVEVMLPDGNTEMRRVRLGLANDQFTEVLEGVQEGEVVVIPTTTTAASRTPAMPGLPSAGGRQMFDIPR